MLLPDLLHKGFSESYTFKVKEMRSKVQGLKIRQVKLKNKELYCIIATDNLTYLVWDANGVFRQDQYFFS
jgi:hypothetical protein